MVSTRLAKRTDVVLVQLSATLTANNRARRKTTNFLGTRSIRDNHRSGVKWRKSRRKMWRKGRCEGRRKS